jgi:hypothetical protein
MCSKFSFIPANQGSWVGELSPEFHSPRSSKSGQSVTVTSSTIAAVFVSLAVSS